MAHSIYGVASTINAANYAMIVALEKTLELGHPLVNITFQFYVNKLLLINHIQMTIGCVVSERLSIKKKPQETHGGVFSFSCGHFDKGQNCSYDHRNIRKAYQ